MAFHNSLAETTNTHPGATTPATQADALRTRPSDMLGILVVCLTGAGQNLAANCCPRRQCRACACDVATCQVMLLVKQMDYSNTQAAAAKISLMMIGHQAILDAYLCLLHLTVRPPSSATCACVISSSPPSHDLRFSDVLMVRIVCARAHVNGQWSRRNKHAVDALCAR